MQARGGSDRFRLDPCSSLTDLTHPFHALLNLFSIFKNIILFLEKKYVRASDHVVRCSSQSSTLACNSLFCRSLILPPDDLTRVPDILTIFLFPPIQRHR